jgi:metallo-beta-lactamase family protein
MLVESTYGDRIHKDEGGVADRLAEEVNIAWKAGGNLIVPAFAVERAHEILFYLSELLRANRIPHLLVFIDSPMAVSVMDVFRRHPEIYDEEMTRLVQSDRSPFDFPGLKMSTSAEDSKAINHIRGTAIVVAGSGMCTGGRVKHHLVRNIVRPESTVLFTGYQAAGTLGREIVNGAKEVRIFGEILPVRARVSQIQGFSGHADREELLRWASGPKPAPRRIFVTHAEPAAAESFAAFLREKLGTRVDVPSYGDEAVLE